MAKPLIAILGVSGSGKTSLMTMLLRLYNIGDGMVKIDGRDIIALGVKEGPEVGEILTKVFEHYLEEKCPNSKGFLINEARNIISTKSV